MNIPELFAIYLLDSYFIIFVILDENMVKKQASVNRFGTPHKKRKTITALSRSRATDEPEIIREWVEERGGKPAVVVAPAGGVKVLSIDFSPYGRAGLMTVPWNEWFDLLEQRHLAFQFQEKDADGNVSWHYELILKW